MKSNSHHNREDTKKRLNELREAVRYHNRKYFSEDKPEISDYAYDMLFRELKELEAAYPELRDEGSPTGEVGYRASDKFQAVTHVHPMLSLENAMTSSEVQSFLKKREKDLSRALDAWVLAPKYDGLAVELTYTKGRLVQGSTRGNGVTGEDVTHTLRYVEGVRSKIEVDLEVGLDVEKLYVRGEVIMTKEGFKALNDERERQGLALFAQARSAAAGSIRQLDPKVVQARDLHFYAYSLKADKDSVFKTYVGELRWLKKVGFETGEFHLCDSFNDLQKRYEATLQKRDHLPYEVDGVVLTVNRLDDHNLLGTAGKRPRYALAWKFPPLVRETVLKAVHFQVGRTGVITPVAELKPVIIGGAKVMRATLHNRQEIIDKDLRLGDTVEVIRSGDVIPKVLRALSERRTGKEVRIRYPKDCPSCGRPLVTDDAGKGILIRCVNTMCRASLETAFRHFVSRDAMDIDGMGREILKELIAKGSLRRLDDLYRLGASDLDKLERMGETLREKLLASIRLSKQASLARFIFALGIRGVGLKTAELLAKKYTTLDAFMQLEKADLQDMNDMGEVVSDHLYRYLQEPSNVAMLNAFKEVGLELQAFSEVNLRKTDHPLAMKKILFTGKLMMSRRLMKEKAEQCGAEIMSSVSASLDYLVVGEAPGSKLKKAEEFGVTILREDAFYRMVGFVP